LAGLAGFASGCIGLLPAPTPMRMLPSHVEPDKQARCLLVFLPGLGDSDEDFVDHGFVDAVRARRLSVDVLSVNATIGYYAKRTLVPRIETDVLAPARASGYAQIWLAGISMGGLGSALVAKQHGNELAGVVLIAPYLGDDRVLREIDGAGGLARWKPPATVDEDDYQHDLWRWLKGATAQPASAPPIYLAAGDQDKLAFGHRLLGAQLPKERVFHTPGKHDWGPWAILWADFLDRSDFRARCGGIP
jgi:pimeloyl-ACP methyl ester carboxylesterase